MHADVIIVGGGISGLIAARKLSEKKVQVVLLEAGDRYGGRINTVYDPSFDTLLETGPEFIHGNLPVTFGLLKEAGIPYYKIEGKSYHHINGKWQQTEDPADGWDKMLRKMQSLEKDMPLADFLEQYFPGEKFTVFKKEVKHYAEGFDLADCHTASTFALRDEWVHEEEAVYRIKGGHSRLSNYLVNICKQHGVIFHSCCKVTRIEWKPQHAKIYTENGRLYTAGKVLLAVPIKALQQHDENNSIQFSPAIPQQQKAAENIGFGTVIKFFFQFKEAFWLQQAPNAGFIISNQVIPTWWTQLPYESNMLTGWLGGPPAKALRNAGEDILLRLAIESLSNIFSTGTDKIKSLLQSFRFVDWSAAPYLTGAYSFATTETAAARRLLNAPLEETIYFAGEAVADTSASATVEAALISGIAASEAMAVSKSSVAA